MKHETFIKIDGIDGDAADEIHKNEIKVSNWSWNIQQEFGSSGGGKASVHNLEFEHDIDRATPNLIKYCLMGKRIPEAVLTVRKSGGAPFDFFKITMTDVIIAQAAPVGSDIEEVRSRERIGLLFAKVKLEYFVQNEKGGSAGAITASYDIKGGHQ